MSTSLSPLLSSAAMRAVRDDPACLKAGSVNLAALTSISPHCTVRAFELVEPPLASLDDK